MVGSHFASISVKMFDLTLGPKSFTSIQGFDGTNIPAALSLSCSIRSVAFTLGGCVCRGDIDVFRFPSLHEVSKLISRQDYKSPEVAKACHVFDERCLQVLR